MQTLVRHLILRCSVLRVRTAPLFFEEERGTKEQSLSSEGRELLKFLLHTFLFKEKYAPLAQLVEQLTLNQWVPGSSP